MTVVDTQRFNSERDAAAAELARTAAVFEAGFKHVRAPEPQLAVSFCPIAKAGSVVRYAEHRECCGQGKTAQEALDDWSTKFAQYPQSGDRVHWRVRPEIDWVFDFQTRAPIWRVYARLAIFETNEVAA